MLLDLWVRSSGSLLRRLLSLSSLVLLLSLSLLSSFDLSLDFDVAISFLSSRLSNSYSGHSGKSHWNKMKSCSVQVQTRHRAG